MSRVPPLTCDEVKHALTQLGFSPAPRQGGSHEQWLKTTDGRRFKVTVDCPKAPFSPPLIASMAHQAGITVADLYRAADKKRKWSWLHRS